MTPEQQKRWHDFFEDARAHLETNPRTAEDAVRSLQAIALDALLAADRINGGDVFKPLEVREFRYVE